MEENWSLDKAKELYRIPNWGEGYFDINSQGHVVVKPKPNNGLECDLYELVKNLIERGIEAPILLRFDGIIQNRVNFLQNSFDDAIKECEYRGSYRLAFPIKVNEQRHVVDMVRRSGKKKLLGLEVGSKPELLAVLAIHDTEGALLLCNGYKDEEYIELALLAKKLGKRSVIIIEQLYELKLALEVAERLGVEAEVGFRMKPSSKGSGRWESSGGDLAKFGLNTHEIVLATDQLRKAEKADWLKLLHFHIGSQITSIAAIKKALREASRMYTELASLCPSLCFFDAGGGLGVDYNGSRTVTESSMNYTVEEYARDVVWAIGSACKEAGIPDPDIITESGRALVAHHSVLVTEVIDVASSLDVVEELNAPPSNHEILDELRSFYQNLTSENCHEILHDAYEMKDRIIEGFIQGSLSLQERAYADHIYRYLIAKIRKVSKELEFVPEDIEKLDAILIDNYFCNFSVFQSLPDAWAIDQVFPVVPLHRLQEEPKRRAIMADLSCDSDGKIDRFIDRKKDCRYVRLHEFDGTTPYYLGIFLVGAYQEILGGLHNLFGDTNAVHVDIDSEGNWELNHVVEGDTINEVLHYVQYDVPDLIESLRIATEKSLRAGRLTNEEAAKLKKRFKEALESYTYLVV